MLTYMELFFVLNYIFNSRDFIDECSCVFEKRGVTKRKMEGEKSKKGGDETLEGKKQKKRGKKMKSSARVQ